MLGTIVNCVDMASITTTTWYDDLGILREKNDETREVARGMSIRCQKTVAEEEEE
jgi:hypothetical protein